jgi:ubiquitin carboxyl-terminal hydrolase 5/13
MNKDHLLSIDCIEKEECSICFEDLDSPGGICVCLSCLQCFCAFRRHAQLHAQKTSHNLYVNLQRLALEEEENSKVESSEAANLESADRSQTVENGPAPQVVRTGDGYTISGAEKLEVPVPPVVLEGIFDVSENCWVARPRQSAASNEPLDRQWAYCRGTRAYAARDIERWTSLAQQVFAAATVSHQEQIHSWELQLQPCEHTLMVSRLEDTRLEMPLTRSAAKCSACELRENLWLCLSCGHLGCGRTNFDGTGGNNHAWEHYKSFGGSGADHAVAVKLGTITADGTADVHCYACDELRTDPDLERHLEAFGIDIRMEEKTEKSLIEMEIEQNMQLSMRDLGAISGEQGATLQRVTDPASLGPELVTTGMRNMGNSCYLSSVLQCIYALMFATYRWYQEPRALAHPLVNKSLDRHYSGCAEPNAMQCFECQMRKLADGLLSQRYWRRNCGSQRIDQLDAPPSLGTPKPAREETPKPVQFPKAQNESLKGPAHAGVGAPELGSNDSEIDRLDIEEERRYTPPEGIAPRMFQQLVGQGHPEFATKRQQDAHEFLEYFLNRCTEEANRNGTRDPTRFFVFPLLERTECLQCHRVLLTTSEATSLYIPIISPACSARYVTRSKAVEMDQARERVSLAECLDLSVASERVSFQCPVCAESADNAGFRQAERRESLSRCPLYLMMHMRRFEAGEGWVPRKVTTAVSLSDPERGLRQSADGEITLDLAPWLVMDESESNRLPPERRMPLPKTSNSETGSASAAKPTDPSMQLLLDMGFSAQQARVALEVNERNSERAIEWLLDDSNAARAATMDSSARSSTTPGTADATVALTTATRTTRYTLAAAMVHLGASVHTGHYVAYLYRNGRWLLYNDEKVFDAGTYPNALEQAYVLIWRLQDGDLNIACREWMNADRQHLESEVAVNQVQPQCSAGSAANIDQRFDGTVLNRNSESESSAETVPLAATLYAAEQAQLMSMGFTAEASREALEAACGNLEAALNLLLSS